MLLRSLFAALFLGASLLLPQDAAEDSARSGDYFVDGSHSSALFRVSHLGVSSFWGRFNNIEGNVTYDAKDASNSRVSVTILAESVDSNNEGRDGHLKSPDFFNAPEFPEMTFRSTKVAAGKHGGLQVTGDFTMLGESKELELDVVHVGHGERGRAGYRSGWETEFTISRSDFGMDFMTGMLGDDVRIILSLETVLK
jgi:polyisoprenoid-binding protein YceI